MDPASSFSDSEARNFPAVAGGIIGYAAEPSICACKSSCQRKVSQRGGCPCRSTDTHCSAQCKCNKKKCKNQPPPESSTSRESQDEESAGTTMPDSPGTTGARVSKDEEFIRDFVKSAHQEKLEEVAIELLRRQPDFLVEMMEDTHTPSAEGSEPTATDTPPWCKCGRCHPMPTAIENKCCKFGNGRCLTTTDAFNDICLNTNVLGVNMRIREDELANIEDRSNANYRHYEYRVYVYWRFGRVGRGNRLIIPSCCITRIRDRFPAPDGAYTGFIPGENLPP